MVHRAARVLFKPLRWYEVVGYRLFRMARLNSYRRHSLGNARSPKVVARAKTTRRGTGAEPSLVFGNLAATDSAAVSTGLVDWTTESLSSS